MTDERAAALLGGVTLLERAVNYTYGSLHLVTPEALARSTPCPAWDLRALLAHLDDSLLALYEAAGIGSVALLPADADPVGDPVQRLRSRACQLVGAWVNAGGDDHTIDIGGTPLSAGVVTGTGAVEITVHGWDVAQACGHDLPIPRSLAEELLDLAPLFVGEADRPGRFAPPVTVPPLASAGDRLVAFLGRRPG